MIRRYTIGGLAFFVDEALPDLESDGFADNGLRVRFIDDSEFRALDAPGLRRVNGQMGLSGVIDPASWSCWLPDTHADAIDRSWYLRQMAPIFSAVLGRLVLHAGAVEMDESVIAFVGESGAGKSTLARFLADRGHRHVADDLLPVRFAPDPSTPVEDELLPLGVICFLNRSTAGTVTVEPLSAVAAMQGLIRHGFGEHGDPVSWGFQFDAYHHLVEAVPIFDLIVPDDLTALPRVAEALVGLVGDHHAPSRIGGG